MAPPSDALAAFQENQVMQEPPLSSKRLRYLSICIIGSLFAPP